MKTIRTIFLFAILSLFVACEEDYQHATFTVCRTVEATNITHTSARLYSYAEGTGMSYDYGFYGKQLIRISDNNDFLNARTLEAIRDYDYAHDANYMYFGADVTDLQPNTTYYFYAVIQSNNGKNEIKGETLSFSTKSLNVPAGAAKGVFSVSSTKQVFFAKGNLQYQASTGTWRFAENQYDYIGDGNLNVSATYSGWIDLFGQGTSGYNGRYPYNTEYTDPYGNPAGDLDGTNYDWGVYNAISNGGNQAGLWRTMNSTECNYLFYKRKNASQLYGLAQIGETNGLIILPDEWKAPADITFCPQVSPYSTNAYRANVYTLDQWAKMEQAGAVFLPAAGGRCFHSENISLRMENVNLEGYYRLSTAEWYNNAPQFAHVFNFNNKDASLTGSNYGAIEWAWAVRLVQDEK